MGSAGIHRAPDHENGHGRDIRWNLKAKTLSLQSTDPSLLMIGNQFWSFMYNQYWG